MTLSAETNEIDLKSLIFSIYYSCSIKGELSKEDAYDCIINVV